MSIRRDRRDRLETDRLTLEPMTREVARAVLAGRPGRPVGRGWPHADTADALAAFVNHANSDEDGGWLVVLRETGEVIGNFSLNSHGDFVIARLPPGAYILRVEPIDDADPESFFPTPVDTDFRVTYAPRMVVAPRGGSSSPIDIQVQPK